MGGDAVGKRRAPETARRRGLGRGLGAIIPASMHGLGDWAQGVDPVTRMADRGALGAAVAEAIESCRGNRSMLAVVLVGLDRLEAVNGEFGDRVGDRLLRDTAERLADIGRRSDTVARFAGDELALVLPRVGSSDNASRIAQRVLDEVRRPVSVDGTEHRLDASVGVVVVEPATSPLGADGVLGLAHALECEVKAAGGGAWRLAEADASPGGDAGGGGRGVVGRGDGDEWRRDKEGGQFELVYEPIVRLDTGAVVGAAAACRRPGAGRGDDGPDAWDGATWVSDSPGAAAASARWSIERSLADLVRRRERDAGGAMVRVWVELAASVVLGGEPARLIEELAAGCGLSPSWIGVDVGPDALADAAAHGALVDLRRAGVAVRVQGPVPVGVGPGWIGRLPVGGLVLDPGTSLLAAGGPGSTEVADGSPGAPPPEDLAAAVIALAVGAGLAVFGTGVRSESQARALADRGCTYGQGPYFGSPVGADAMWGPGRRR